MRLQQPKTVMSRAFSPLLPGVAYEGLCPSLVWGAPLALLRWWCSVVPLVLLRWWRSVVPLGVVALVVFCGDIYITGETLGLPVLMTEAIFFLRIGVQTAWAVGSMSAMRRLAVS